ncbi:MAG: c-type cytochrome [Planctomycetes bacterium]|nr:c-type cytochrome [Planctomycetota bacterium]
MDRFSARVLLLLSAFWVVVISAPAAENEPFIPRRQSKPPGPALSPADAIKQMTVPEGFKVELVASEPDIVNPVAMTFDERGRIWITESFEYPRSSAGPGRDRVKVLEDTDSDGRVDKVTVFAEGLNIPSGIAVGAGGVWVANAPDILFLQDTDGDGRADKQEVVVTGFGRADTHELPNSLTWGPDGWLYGLNGVFNPSVVENQGKKYEFTCALFRIHPRTRKFELFCEGTSNPWGVAWDVEGSAFVSACVIDHLWHLVETGYYHRQGGPYPPFTWKIESIVKHKHQMAAYCGLHYYDSDAYPEQYRQKLYMGNIHGGCINSDRLERKGSTYEGKPEPDFLTANDVWFMPVVQKTGPDGCLYILDWYDRYHCYQDARHDPEGIDRLKGRLYRVRYQDTPRAKPFDMSKESDDELIARLSSGNDLYRDLARRVLWERATPEIKTKLEQLVLDFSRPTRERLLALWARIACGPLPEEFNAMLLVGIDSNPSFAAWGVRAAAQGDTPEKIRLIAVGMIEGTKSPDILLQLAAGSRKLARNDTEAILILMQVASQPFDDPLIPHIVWQNLYPLLENKDAQFSFLGQLKYRTNDFDPRSALVAIVPRAFDKLLSNENADPRLYAKFLDLRALGPQGEKLAGRCVAILASKIQSGEISGNRSARLRSTILPGLAGASSDKNDLWIEEVILGATWGDSDALAVAHSFLTNEGNTLAKGQVAHDRQLQALRALIAGRGQSYLKPIAGILTRKETTLNLKRGMIEALGRSHDDAVADVVLAAYPQLEPELQPQVIELLTQRPTWSRALLKAVEAKQIAASAVNVNQVRQLQALKDPELAKFVAATWGTVRIERNPNRERVVTDMRNYLRGAKGDPHAGVAVFQKLCGQCHKLYGQGQEVGPDITVNGRSSLEQLLSNVFDPSLVIGGAYLARTVITTDGRVLTGLVAEDNAQRVVLKLQGGKLETIARGDIDEMDVSKLSLMPEGVEKLLNKQELADLFAYLMLDKPPTDPTAKRLPDTAAPSK